MQYVESLPEQSLLLQSCRSTAFRKRKARDLSPWLLLVGELEPRLPASGAAARSYRLGEVISRSDSAGGATAIELSTDAAIEGTGLMAFQAEHHANLRNSDSHASDFHALLPLSCVF